MDPITLSLAKRQMIGLVPAHYARDVKWQQKTGVRTSLTSPTALTVNINNVGYYIKSTVDIDATAAAAWDSTAIDYTQAANRAGKDFYIYACQQNGTAPKFMLSANSTIPTGYTANNSRKIGGFHCLCVNVGTISGHTLTGYVAGDILPASVWDLKHRPFSNPEGMVYSDQLNLWVDIYLQSGTGVNTKSVNNGVITDNRMWNDFVDDLATVGKKLLDDTEFQIAAEGCNQQTNITGSSDPDTTAGHTDTAGRRMISNIGCEDMAGTIYQWLRDQSYQYDGAGHTHTVNVTGDAQTGVVTSSTNVTPTFGWKAIGDNKGQIYSQGTYGDVKLLAGGYWSAGTVCGSRCRAAYSSRWYAAATVGSRGRAEPLREI